MVTAAERERAKSRHVPPAAEPRGQGGRAAGPVCCGAGTTRLT